MLIKSSKKIIIKKKIYATLIKGSFKIFRLCCDLYLQFFQTNTHPHTQTKKALFRRLLLYCKVEINYFLRHNFLIKYEHNNFHSKEMKEKLLKK